MQLYLLLFLGCAVNSLNAMGQQEAELCQWNIAVADCGLVIARISSRDYKDDLVLSEQEALALAHRYLEIYPKYDGLHSYLVDALIDRGSPCILQVMRDNAQPIPSEILKRAIVAHESIVEKQQNSTTND